jgi:soluble lytic murein transglycosylase-like protein
MLIRLFLIVATALSAWPAQAEAQIYAWRDGSGTLVLSDRRLDPGASVRTYAVAGSPAVRATRQVVPAVSQQFEPLVQEHATRHGIRPDLVRAVIQVESAFNPTATSPKGAMGLMQLMPGTARELGVANAYDPAQNIRGGTLYLRQLLDRYEGNEELALAAYNAGFNAVDRYGRQVPPYNETQNYVRKVGAAADGTLTAGSTATAGSTTAARPMRRVIYKTIVIIDGRPVASYSTERPTSGTYEIIER